MDMREKIMELIKMGENIQENHRIERNRSAQSGFLSLGPISGRDYDTWVSKVDIFNERNLKSHPLYSKINSSCFHKEGKFNEIIGHLQAVYDDNDFFELTPPSNVKTNGISHKNFAPMSTKAPIIFLSHNSKDKKYGDALASLLRNIGIKDEQLIYTSHERHKILLGENIYHYLNKHLGDHVHMVFLLSDNYFDSVPCLCEMGAGWLAHSDYTVFYVPGFSPSSPKLNNCPIDRQQIGVVLNGDRQCKASLIEFKDIISNIFKLQVSENTWMSLQEDFLSEIVN